MNTQNPSYEGLSLMKSLCLKVWTAATSMIVVTLHLPAGVAAAETFSNPSDYHSNATVKYVIETDGPNIVARNQLTNLIDCSGQNFRAVLQCGIDNLTSGRLTAETVAVNGTFELTSVVNIPSYTTLDLGTSLITRSSSANSKMFQNSDRPAGNTEIRILGGTIDGNSDQQTVHPPYPGPGTGSQYVVYFDHVTGAEITGTAFLDSGPDATVHADDTSNLSIDSISIENSLYETIFLRRGAGNRVTNSTFTTVGTAVATATSSDATISGNTITDTVTTSAISVNGLRNIVSHNIVTNAGGTGIAIGHAPDATLGDIYNASDSVIQFNEINGAGGIGIHMVNGSANQDVEISDNTIGNAREGIAIGPSGVGDGVRNITVHNNTISNSDRMCIRVNGSPGLAISDIFLTDNTCLNSSQISTSDPRFSSAVAIYSFTGGEVARVQVSGNILDDTQPVPTQEYAMYISNTEDVILSGNQLFGSIATYKVEGSNPGLVLQ